MNHQSLSAFIWSVADLLRDTENALLSEEVEACFKREVLPHAPVFEPPRPLTEIDANLAEVTARIKAMIEGLAA